MTVMTDSKYGRFKDEFGYLLKPFVILNAIYVLALSSLIRADFNYIDDLGRIARGYRSGENFSRHISHFLAIFVHGGLEISDISPLPQLMAVVFVALASCVILYRFADKKISLWSIAAVLPLGLSPHFLACFSYKFDSLWMAFSLFCTIMPLLFIESRWGVYFVSVVVGTLVMCQTYQAFSGLIVVVAVMYLAKKWNEGTPFRDVFVKFLVASVAFVLSMLFYKFFLVTEVPAYVDSSIASLPHMLDNVLLFLTRIRVTTTRFWQIMAVMIYLGFACSLASRSARCDWLVFLLAFPFLAGCGVASYGAYIALQKPIFALRALGAFCVVLAIASVVAVNNGIWWNWIIKLSAAALAWSLLVFALTYGNALAEQKRYTDFRIQMVLADLTRTVQVGNAKSPIEIQLAGDIGKSPIVRRLEKNYRVLAELVPRTLGAGGGWTWNEPYFFNYFALPKVKQARLGAKNIPDFSKMDLQTVYKCCYHEIKSDGQHVLIKFF